VIENIVSRFVIPSGSEGSAFQ